MSDPSPTGNGLRRAAGVALRKHLEALRIADLREVHAFWQPDAEALEVPKRDLVERLQEAMSHEGTVYRRVRTLTRKVLDVLLLLLRRAGYGSDLPGLFQRLPGEGALALEYHEAEAGVKALCRRGFLAEVTDRRMATNGRVRYAVPEELGRLLTALFREETRTVRSVFTLVGHSAAITAAERVRLRSAFPTLGEAPQPGDAATVLAGGGAPALLERLPRDLRAVVEHAAEHFGGLMLRAEWSARTVLSDIRWNRERWGTGLEESGIGTVARLSLKPYGIEAEDEVVVVFREVLEDLLRRADEREPEHEEILRPGGDAVADLCAFLEHVRLHPVRVGRTGEVHRAARRKIEEGFVSRESFLAGAPEVWAEVQGAVSALGLLRPDDEGFLEPTPAAERFLRLPLEGKAQELYHVAREQAGPGGRSLHQHEMRGLLAECLREEPVRWWSPRALVAVARHRYFATLDERGIQERYRDRHFSAYFPGTETPRDLSGTLEREWLRRLFVLGLLDVAAKEERMVAVRLSSLGARVLGAATTGLDTGLQPLLVNPDFEVVVLPEGDVSDVVHTLDGYAQRTQSGEVTHFRFTRSSVETAVAAGRPIADLMTFLRDRARGGVPQNVEFTIRRWAEGVTFATLERGVVLRVEEESALDRVLGLPDLRPLLVRRLSPTDVLLKEEPRDRRLLAALRAQGIHLQGP